MSQERLSMRKLKEVLRLHYDCGLSNRAIARSVMLSPTTVGHYLSAAEQSQLTYAELSTLDDRTLTARLSPHCPQLHHSPKQKATIDFKSLHCELKKKGVTRELLHEEYVNNNPSYVTVSYSEFCRQYREFRKQLKPSMRQMHIAGEKTFVDYAGPTVPIYDATSSKIAHAMIFVGVLGASNYTFAEATMTRSLADWTGSHVRMFNYFGGVTQSIIPDNEKSAVSKACYYQPEVNPHYTALAAHYNTAIIPARPYHPKDKAKAEVAVQVVERWILARLRHLKFFSLVQLNQAIAKLLVVLNDKPFKKLPGSRRSTFESLEKPALKPLPTHPYEFKVIEHAQVRLDYHVEVDKHYYSVPHHYINQRVEYQLTQRCVAIFCEGNRIAYHIRAFEAGKATTLSEHMPKAHQRYANWTPKSFLEWSQQVGTNMTNMAQHLIDYQPNPECCQRIHLGFLNLAKRYTKARLESACQYACTHYLFSYRHVKSILKTQCDKAPLLAANDHCVQQTTESCQHTNLRGPDYYSTNKE